MLELEQLIEPSTERNNTSIYPVKETDKVLKILKRNDIEGADNFREDLDK